jgi:cation:H+ antiporter
MILCIFIFLGSCVLLFFAGKWMVTSLIRIARYLEWREFVVAFIIVAVATSIPNLFVGITAALHKIPELSLGDIVGGNLFDLTMAVALATLFARGLPAASKMVQTSAIFTIVAAVLPMFLLWDKTLGRGDAVILIFLFFFYIYWLFSKKERFTKIYDGKRLSIIKEFKIFIKDLGRLILSLLFLLLAAEGIVYSASVFSEVLNLPLGLIGILVVGIGSAIPETYFAIMAARKFETWMILGNIMGSVVIIATLVLGIVALIYPIQISDFSPFAIARVFLIIAAMFFIFFVRTDRKITIKEAFFLLGLYLAFFITEILVKS